MAARDPYSVLGVPRGADAAAIKKAFRAKARTAHPDSNPDDPKAEDRFKEITKAYEIIGDAQKRARFDRGEIDADGNETVAAFGGGRRAGGAGFGGFGGGARGFSFEDLFGGGGAESFEDILRGGGGRAGGFRPKGGNTSYTLKVTLIEALNGATKRVGLTNGKTLDVRIPPGTETGKVLRLKGQGQPGPAGAPPGDALIEVVVEDHPLFKRREHDILLDLPVTLKEAVLGAKVTVPTPTGAVALTIPKGASSGKQLRLRGKGAPFTLPGDTLPRHGDLIVTLMIAIPERDAALEAFAEAWTPQEADPRKGML